MKFGIVLCIACAPCLAELGPRDPLGIGYIQDIPKDLQPLLESYRGVVKDDPEFGYSSHDWRPQQLDTFRKLLAGPFKDMLAYALHNFELLAQSGVRICRVEDPNVKPLGVVALKLLNIHVGTNSLEAGGLPMLLPGGWGDSQHKIHYLVAKAQFETYQRALLSLFKIQQSRWTSVQLKRAKCSIVAMQVKVSNSLPLTWGLWRGFQGYYQMWGVEGVFDEPSSREVCTRLEQELLGIPRVFGEAWGTMQEAAILRLGVFKLGAKSLPFQWEEWSPGVVALEGFQRLLGEKHPSQGMIKMCEVMDKIQLALIVETMRLKSRLIHLNSSLWMPNSMWDLKFPHTLAEVGPLAREIVGEEVASLHSISEGLEGDRIGTYLEASRELGPAFDGMAQMFLAASDCIFRLVGAIWKFHFESRDKMNKIPDKKELELVSDKVAEIVEMVRGILKAGISKFEGAERDQLMVRLLPQPSSQFIFGAEMLIMTLRTEGLSSGKLRQCWDGFSGLLFALDQVVPPMVDYDGETRQLTVNDLFYPVPRWTFSNPFLHSWESIFGDLQRSKPAHIEVIYDGVCG